MQSIGEKSGRGKSEGERERRGSEGEVHEVKSDSGEKERGGHYCVHVRGAWCSCYVNVGCLEGEKDM